MKLVFVVIKNEDEHVFIQKTHMYLCHFKNSNSPDETNFKNYLNFYSTKTLLRNYAKITYIRYIENNEEWEI